MDGLPYTIHGISMKWRQYRWCQNIALCYDVLREMKPSSHVPLYEDETVGDCVLIKLQSYFSMAPSDCVWLWTQWLFIAAIEFELFFLLLCIILLYCFALLLGRLQYETIPASNGSMQSNYYWTDTIPRQECIAFIPNLISFLMLYVIQ